MGKVNAYMMDVQSFVWDFYNSSGDFDTATGVKTTADVLAKVKEEFGGGMAVDGATQEIAEIEGGYF